MMANLSALGDTAFLLPASIAFAIYLVALRHWVLAASFGLVLLLGGSATILAKLLFNACGTQITSLDVISPSGHASFAAMVYGSVAVGVAARRPPAQRVLVWAAALVLVGGVAASRVALGWHSTAEVLLGLAIGTAAASTFVLLHERAGRPALPPGPLVVGLLVLVILVGGRNFTPEGYIVRIARDLSKRFEVCVDAPSAQLRLRMLRGSR